MRNKLLELLCLVCMCLCNTRCFAQVEASQFAGCFESLGRSKILNEFMVLEPTRPKLAVLAEKESGEEIYLFSVTGNQCQPVWHLSQLPPSIEVIDPSNLKITYTDEGPIITLHGCARHLCGGKGSAGAFMYSISSGKMRSALANWNSHTNRVDISYSASGNSLTPLEKSLLDAMLREEGY